MDERRQLPRWQVKKEAKVWLPQMQEFSPCMIEDINLKGMSISLNKLLSQRRINMSFALDDDFDFIKIEAYMPWVSKSNGKYYYGLFFNKIREWDKEKVDRYINKHCYDQFKDKWWA